MSWSGFSILTVSKNAVHSASVNHFKRFRWGYRLSYCLIMETCCFMNLAEPSTMLASDLKIIFWTNAIDFPWLTGMFLCSCSISITTSCYPLPSICFRDPVSDWFESLAECLHWNVRKKQNNFAVEEEEFWVSTSNKTHGNGKWQYPF